MSYVLQIVRGPNAGAEFAVTDEETYIGRDPKCQVVIPDRSVSRTHARITRVDASWFIGDCGSRNGTFVNGRQIHSNVHLEANDEIVICSTTFRFRTHLPRASESANEDSTLVVDAIDVSDSTTGKSAKTQAEAKLQALLRLMQTLRATLDLEHVLSKVLDGVFDVFPQAFRGLILLREGQELAPRAVKIRDGSQQEVQYSRPLVENAMLSRQGILSQDARQTTASGTDIGQQPATRSLMCVPLLRSDGLAMGAIQIETETSASRFDVDDLQILNCAATQLAVSVEYAKLHRDLLKHERLRKELDFARAVQHGFLPRKNPELPGYRFWASYEPARQVGGDFLDFIHLSNGNLAVLLGDVAGKGIPASLVMAKVSTLCKVALCREPSDLAAAMRLINRETCQMRGVGNLITLVICVVNPGENVVAMSSAGHMSPIICLADANLQEPLDHAQRGLPLGVKETEPYGAVTISMDQGDCVMLYSDGITEATSPNGELYSKQGIFRVMGQAAPSDPAALGQAVLDDVRRHEDGREQSDDMSLIVFDREEATPID